MIRSWPCSSDVTERIDGGRAANETVLNSVVCDSARTTCWTEAKTKKESSWEEPRMLSEMIQRSEPIEKFMSKPYLIDTVQYTTGTAANTNLYNVDIASLLGSVTQWANKIQGFALVRGTFVARVEVNAYPFQSGLLLMHYLPNYADIVAGNNTHLALSHNGCLNAKYQHPFIECNLRDTVMEMRIPYISPTSYYGIKEAYCDWGRLFVDAVTPLRTGSSGLTFAEVAVYGYWEDFELTAPSLPQSDSRIVLESTGSISNGLSKISKAAGILTGVPSLSDVAAPVEWLTNIAAKIASVLGWSKAPLNEPPRCVTRQTMRYAGTADASDTAVPGGVIYNNEIVTTTRYSVTKEDEMSFAYLLKIPSYVTTLQWTTGNASGTSLYSNLIGPMAANQGPFTVTHNAHTATYYQGAPIWYYSNLFATWRGDIKLRLKIIKTDYHSGRLQITFTPGTSTGVSPTLATSILSLRHIVDIREQNEVEFNLPYMVLAPYLNTGSHQGSSLWSGLLDIIVLNDLRAPETCSNTVDILVFMYAGDNFEFQIPCQSQNGTAPFIPQSNTSIEEVLIKSGIADTPIKPLTTLYSSNCVGEHVLSLKQFLNRFSQLLCFSSTSSQLISQSYKIDYFPYYAGVMSINPSTGALSIAPYGGDAYSFIAPCYAFYRGGSRFWMYSDGPSSSSGTKNGDPHFQFFQVPGVYYNVAALCGVDTQTNAVSQGGPGPSTFVKGNSTNFMFAAPHPNDFGTGMLGGHLPYYSRWPTAHVCMANGTDNMYTTDPTGPLTAARISLSNNANTFDSSTIFGRSFNDDFTLSFFIGCPPLLTNYA